VADLIGAMVSGNTETGISVTYQDSDNTLDFALAAAQTTVDSILAPDLVLGEDAQTKIDFGTANQIQLFADNALRVTLSATELDLAVDLSVDGAMIQNGAQIRQGGHLDLGAAARTLTAGDSGTYDIKNVNEIEVTAPAGSSTRVILPGAGDLGAAMSGTSWDLMLMNDWDNSRMWATNKTFILDAPSGVHLQGTDGANETLRTDGVWRLTYYLQGSDHQFYLDKKGDASWKSPSGSFSTSGALVRHYNGYGSEIMAGYSAANKIASVSADGKLSSSGATLFTAGAGGQVEMAFVSNTTTANDESITLDSSAVKNTFLNVDARHTGFTVILPAASVGRMIFLKDVAGGESWTVDPPGGVTIDGAGTLTMDMAKSSVSMISDGTNWWLF